MKKVSFLGYKDYANIMTEYAKAINKYCDGFEARVICELSHPIDFGKPHDYDLYDWDESKTGKGKKNEPIIKRAKEWLKESEHIIFAEEKKPIWYDLMINPPQYRDQEEYLHVLDEASKLDTYTRLEGWRDLRNILNMDFFTETRAGLRGNIHLYHTGSIYRDSNDFFNIMGIKHFNKLIHGVDLYRLSWYNPNDKYTHKQETILDRFNLGNDFKEENHLAIYTSYDKDYKKEEVLKNIDKKFDTNKILIFHAMTGQFKLSHIIDQVVGDLVNTLNRRNKRKGIDVEYEYITPQTYEPIKHLVDEKSGWVPNEEIMKLKEMCHLYVDEFNPMIGYFGGSSVEALMTGNVTFATINNFEEDAKIAANKNIDASDCPVIHLGSNPQQFRRIMKEYMDKPIEELKEIAKEGLEWYYKTSTHRAVATKFEKEILI